MSEFVAKVIAELDDSQLKNIEKTQYTLNNIKPNTSNLVSQIQSVLNSHTFTIKINSGSFNGNGLVSDAKHLGASAGKTFSASMTDSLKSSQMSAAMAKIERDNLQASYNALKSTNKAKANEVSRAYNEYRLADKRYTEAFKSEQAQILDAAKTANKQQLIEAQTSSKERLINFKSEQAQKKRLSSEQARLDKEKTKLGSSTGVALGGTLNGDTMSSYLKDKYATGSPYSGYNPAMVKAAGTVNIAGREFQKFNIEVEESDGIIRKYTTHIDTLTGDVYKLNKGLYSVGKSAKRSNSKGSNNSLIPSQTYNTLFAQKQSQQAWKESAKQTRENAKLFRDSVKEGVRAYEESSSAASRVQFFKNASPSTIRTISDDNIIQSSIRNSAWDSVYGGTYKSGRNAVLANGGTFEAADAVGNFDVQTQQIQEYGSALTGATNSLKKYVAVPIAAAAALSVKNFMDYETAFTGVRKTVDGTDEELQAVSDGLEQMALRVPVASTELANIAMIGGQLGVPTQNLLNYTESFAALQTATNLQGEEGAAVFARLMNVLGEDYSQIENVGSAIVDLGNHTATTESDIANMAMRVGSTSSIIGMSTPDVLGYSAALSSLGVAAEMGGSSMIRIWQNIDSAVSTGEGGLETYAEKAGLTVQEFQKSWKDNPTTAFNALLKGLSESGDMIGDLSELGIANVRDIQAIEKLAGRYDLVTECLQRANTAYQENTALQTEADRAYDTTASRLEMTKESIVQASRDIGGAIAPTVVSLTAGVSDAAKGFSELDEGTQQGITTGALFTAGTILATNAMGNFITNIAATRTGLSKLVQWGTKAIPSLGTALTAVGAAAPYIAVGVAAIAGAVIVGKKAYDAWYKSQYKWTEGLSESQNTVRNSLAKYKELDELSTEVKQLNFVISNPESSTQQIDTAKARLDEIREILSQEYNLVINTDNSNLQETVDNLKDISKNQLQTNINTQKAKLSGLVQKNANYTNDKNELQAQWDEAVESQKKYSDGLVQITQIQSSMQAGNLSAQDALQQAQEIYKNLYGYQKRDFTTDSDQGRVNEIVSAISENYGLATTQADRYKAKVDDLDASHKELVATCEELSNWETELIKLAVKNGDTVGVTQALRDMNDFIQIGDLDKSGYAQAASLAMNGIDSYSDVLDKLWSGDTQSFTNFINDYISAMHSFNASNGEVVNGVAMLQNGFSHASEITGESISKVIADMQELGKQNGFTANDITEYTSLLVSGFDTVKQAAESGQDGINKVLHNMISVGQQQGVFTGSESWTDTEGKLNNLAHSIGLIPESKTIRINAEGNGFDILDGDGMLSNKGQESTYFVTVDENVQTNGTDIGYIENAMNKLDGRKATVTVSADGASGSITLIDGVERKLHDIDNTNHTAKFEMDDGITATIDLLTSKIVALDGQDAVVNITANEDGLSGIETAKAALSKLQEENGAVSVTIQADGTEAIIQAGNAAEKLKANDGMTFSLSVDENGNTDGLKILDESGNETYSIPLNVQPEVEEGSFDFVSGLKDLLGETGAEAAEINISVKLNTDNDFVSTIVDETGRLDELNGQTYSVTLDANNTPLSVKIGETQYQLSNYDGDSHTAILTAENGQALGVINLTTGAINSVPDKNATVTATGVDNGVSAVKGIIDSTSNRLAYLTGVGVDNGVSALVGLWNSIHSKTVTLYTNTVNTVKNVISNVGGKVGNVVGKVKSALGGVDGTAYTDGTAFAHGTSYKTGDWGTKKSGVALGGELGEELIVRDGKYFTVGSDSAEFFKYKKDDIIFNAAQTKEIFSKGKITHGKKRGTALADGTAGKRGFAFADGSDDKPSYLNWVEAAIDRLKRVVDNLASRVEDTYSDFTVRTDALMEQTPLIKQQIELQRQAYDRYMQQANSVGLDENWAAKVRNGEVNIDSITDDDLKEKIDNYQKWYEKALDCNDAMQDLNKTLKEQYSTAFDNLVTDYENTLAKFKHETNILDERISRAKAKGLMDTSKYYEAQRKVEEKNLLELRNEEYALKENLQQALDSGTVQMYFEEWHQMQDDINDVNEKIEETKTKIVELGNSMREVTWDRFDYAMDAVSEFTKESDFLIDLLEYKNLYNTDGSLSKYGTAAIGLHGVNYNTYMEQALAYQKAAEQINEQLQSDPYNTDLIERRQELIKLQRESILSAEDEKDAVIDLVKDGMEEELDSMNELIESYTSALDAEKDLYDYRNKIEDKTKGIAKIQKQLAAYENDTSEETKATVQKLKVELEEAQQDLEETQYDQYISDQKALLDDLYAQYESLINAQTQDTEQLFSDTIKQINNSASDIQSTLVSATADVGTTISDDMNRLWTDVNGAIMNYSGITNGFYQKMDGYFNTGFSDSATGLQDVIENALSGVNLAVEEGSGYADSYLKADQYREKMKNNSLAWYTSDSAAQKELAAENAKYAEYLGLTRDSDGNYYDEDGNLFYTVDNDEKISAMVEKMKENSAAWATSSNKSSLESANVKMANYISQISGEDVWKDGNGVWWIGNRELYSYKSGGLADFTGAAWLDGTPSEPELVLNAKDTENFLSLRDTLQRMSKQGFSVDGFNYGSTIAPRLNDMTDISSMLYALKQSSNDSGSKSIGNIEINIPIEHVDDYNDFISQLSKDKQFEKFVRSVSVDLLSGGSTLAKNKYRW